jgi:organic hydroperoxide reductase OsmC/OhrA
MHRYEARIAWNRNGATFTDNRYSRGHEWSFDGGLTIPGSSSPLVVPSPMSVAAAIDPEEALVASISSCHMLWFLGLASRAGFVVERYDDQAFGVMERNPHGKIAFTGVTLRPDIEFGGDRMPTGDEIAALHHRAHEECYIANSVNFEVTVQQL